jgi:hypothetical protein
MNYLGVCEANCLASPPAQQPTATHHHMSRCNLILIILQTKSLHIKKLADIPTKNPAQTNPVGKKEQAKR